MLDRFVLCSWACQVALLCVAVDGLPQGGALAV